jgi:hypothetical protein
VPSWLIRKLDAALLGGVKERAKAQQYSLEEQVRQLLCLVVVSQPARRGAYRRSRVAPVPWNMASFWTVAIGPASGSQLAAATSDAGRCGTPPHPDPRATGISFPVRRHSAERGIHCQQSRASDCSSNDAGIGDVAVGKRRWTMSGLYRVASFWQPATGRNHLSAASSDMGPGAGDPNGLDHHCTSISVVRHRCGHRGARYPEPPVTQGDASSRHAFPSGCSISVGRRCGVHPAAQRPRTDATPRPDSYRIVTPAAPAAQPPPQTPQTTDAARTASTSVPDDTAHPQTTDGPAVR